MNTQRLTNLQRELLGLFAQELTDDELREVRRVLARHFAARATEAMDRVAAERGLTPADFERWSHEHERASTDRS